MEREKRQFNKKECNREQERYKSHYRLYIIGKLYNHPEFVVGKYLYHLRMSEKWDVIKSTTGGVVPNLLFHWHSIRRYYYSYKCGLQIGLHSCDYGIRVFHYGHIIINGGARIGKNLSIYPGVTIGQVDGDYMKTPIIGNDVWVFANAMIQGDIKIGDNAIIAPNSVVTHDVPENAIVAGVPAKIIGFVK